MSSPFPNFSLRSSGSTSSLQKFTAERLQIRPTNSKPPVISADGTQILVNVQHDFQVQATTLGGIFAALRQNGWTKCYRVKSLLEPGQPERNVDPNDQTPVGDLQAFYFVVQIRLPQIRNSGVPLAFLNFHTTSEGRDQHETKITVHLPKCDEIIADGRIIPFFAEAESPIREIVYVVRFIFGEYSVICELVSQVFSQKCCSEEEESEIPKKKTQMKKGPKKEKKSKKEVPLADPVLTPIQWFRNTPAETPDCLPKEHSENQSQGTEQVNDSQQTEDHEGISLQQLWDDYHRLFYQLHASMPIPPLKQEISLQQLYTEYLRLSDSIPFNRDIQDIEQGARQRATIIQPMSLSEYHMSQVPSPNQDITTDVQMKDLSLSKKRPLDQQHTDTTPKKQKIEEESHSADGFDLDSVDQSAGLINVEPAANDAKNVAEDRTQESQNPKEVHVNNDQGSSVSVDESNGLPNLDSEITQNSKEVDVSFVPGVQFNLGLFSSFIPASYGLHSLEDDTFGHSDQLHSDYLLSNPFKVEKS